MLHKPALLGILGAVIGLSGYKENGKLPEYYNILRELRVGIQPLNSDKGNYTKTVIKYNNGTGFANVGILNISEQVLISPSFRCYLLLNLGNNAHATLLDYLKNGKAEYIPYMGKNEFSAWWSNVQEYPNARLFEFDKNYKIKSIFSKTSAVGGYIAQATTQKWGPLVIPFLYFERLPIGFDERFKQYEYADFVYSNATFQKRMKMKNTGEFMIINDNDVIQLF